MNDIINKFIRWLKIQIGFYCLHDDEIYLWQSIKTKAENGYKEYLNEPAGPPWVTELNTNEIRLLYKIHDAIMGDDWYIADPLGAKQVHYIMFENIKNKVIW